MLGLTTYLLSRTGRTARNELATRLATRDMRLWHMAVLAALEDFGPHVQRELAVRLRIDRSDIVKIVEDLAGGGYVTRARDTADRRRVMITPTRAGGALLADLETEAVAVQDDLLGPLDAAERAQLTTLLGRVHAHVQDRGQSARRPGR